MENSLLWSHKALIYGETLAQSLCMCFWLIDSLCCRGLQRMSTIWSRSALHNNKEWLWDLCEQFCWFWESVWAEHVQTLLPRRLFCLCASYKWQHRIAAAILAKREGGGGQRRGWSTFCGGAGNTASYDRRGVNSKEGNFTVRAEKTQNNDDELETFDFSCMGLGLQHRKWEDVCFCAAEISLLSMFVCEFVCVRGSCSFFCSIGIPPDSSPHGDGALPSPL